MEPCRCFHLWEFAIDVIIVAILWMLFMSKEDKK